MESISLPMGNGKRRRGQSLAEFALTLPVLLLVFMIVIDFGRALLAYAQASAAVRNALRFGVIIGDDPTARNYLNCNGMQSIASNLLFIQTNTVTVQYVKARALPSHGLSQGAVVPCNFSAQTPAQLDAKLRNGDILRIQVQGTLNFLTPFIPFSLPINISGQRTLVKDIAIYPSDASTFVDVDGDGLNDNWEIAYFGDITSYNGTDDPDGDGCDNRCEYIYGCNPLMVDTDGDSLSDYDEIFIHGTRCDDADSDDDGLDDDVEVLGLHGWAPTNPNDPDTDGDGLSDFYEVYISLSDPNDPNDPGFEPVTDLGIWPEGSNCQAMMGGDRYIGLQWNPMASAEGYYIYANGYLVGQTVGGSSTSCGYSATGCFNLNPLIWDPNAPLTYQVYGYIDVLVGPHSPSVTITCSPSQPVLPAVTGLEQWTGGSACTDPDPANRYIGLSWNPVVGADGYNIYADGALVGKVTGTQCGSMVGAPGGCYNLDAGAWSATAGHSFQVQATSSVGPLTGALSSALNLTCGPVFSDQLVTGLAAIGAQCGGSNETSYINLTWDPVPGAEGYRIYAGGLLSGQVAGTQCGDSLDGADGCFNITTANWNATAPVEYQIVAYQGGDETGLPPAVSFLACAP